MKPRTKGIVVVGFIVLSLCPLPISVRPASTIRAIDSTGSPVGGVRVYRGWEHLGSGARGSEEKLTDAAGVADFEKRSALMVLIGQILSVIPNPIAVHASRGAVTSFEIYCPRGYELALEQSGYTALGRSGDFANFKGSSGDYVLVDCRPPNPVFKVDYSARVCLHYKQADPIRFTLPVRKIKQETP